VVEEVTHAYSPTQLQRQVSYAVIHAWKHPQRAAQHEAHALCLLCVLLPRPTVLLTVVLRVKPTPTALS
jgi:hypothetical protein